MKTLWCAALAFVGMVVVAVSGWVPTLSAQNSTTAFQGLVTIGPNQPLAGATVMVRDLAQGTTRQTATNGAGFFYLGGLTPNRYAIRVQAVGYRPQVDTVLGEVGSTSRLDFVLSTTTAQLQEVEVRAQRNAAIDLRTAEQATVITQEQLENLPTTDRNFLDYARLAPTVQPRYPDNKNTALVAGAEPAENTNVFIDGQSYKNDVLLGGVVGQNASRGNPFPQSAVQEFRVVTDQYGAEYQKSSGAMITATTKSGTNEWHGGIFGFGEIPYFTARDWYTTQRGFPVPNSRRLLTGANIGGPIIKDKLHVFLDYEGNYQNLGTDVVTGSAPWSGFLNPRQYDGSSVNKFREDLFFGKLSYDFRQDQRFELSATDRHETYLTGYGNLNGTPTWTQSVAENDKQDVWGVSLKHRWSPGHWLNEAMASFQQYLYNPAPVNFNTPGQWYDGGASVERIGGKDTYQKFTQNRYSLRNDLTYAGLRGLGDHVIKGGVSYDYLDYKVTKKQNGNPQFFYFPDTTAANAYRDTIPYFAQFGTGNPNAQTNNVELGAYIQDNWTVTRRLTLNLGIRWDYETNDFDNRYVTPAAIRAAYSQIDTETGKPLVTNNYFTNGHERPPFARAFQPRVSGSFDLTGDGKTIAFGGFGIYYDREYYNATLDERFRLQYSPFTTYFFDKPGGVCQGNKPCIPWNPGLFSRHALDSLQALGNPGTPQVFFIDNNARLPHTQQFSGGVRRVLGRYTVSASYVGSRGYDYLTYVWVGLHPNGTCCYQVKNYSGALMSENSKTWYNALVLNAQRPFHYGDRWGGGISYTYGEARKNGNDLFSLDYPRPWDYPIHRVPGDQQSVVVANAIVAIPFGFTLSGIATLSSGAPYTLSQNFPFPQLPYNCFDCGNPPRHDFLFLHQAFAYEDLDLTLKKSFRTFHSQRVGLEIDMFNVTDAKNPGCYNGNITATGPGPLGSRFGEPACAGLDNQGRVTQLGIFYNF